VVAFEGELEKLNGVFVEERDLSVGLTRARPSRSSRSASNIASA